MPEEGSRWDLENFLETFDVWTASEDPSTDVRAAVLTWIFSQRHAVRCDSLATLTLPL